MNVIYETGFSSFSPFPVNVFQFIARTGRKLWSVVKWTTANICHLLGVSSECFNMESYLWLYVWLIASLWSSYCNYLWGKHRGHIRIQ